MMLFTSSHHPRPRRIQCQISLARWSASEVVLPPTDNVCTETNIDLFSTRISLYLGMQGANIRPDPLQISCSAVGAEQYP